jgi:predicted dehydrogenase
MERRDFLRSGVASTALATQRILGANDRVQVALIGAGGRGRGVTSYVAKVAGAEIAGVSDVYLPRREEAAAQFGPTAKPFTDYRAILDSKDIDAVIIATPDHWHTPMTVEAVQAGKDVYCEKPVTHHLEEGERLIRAVDESKRIVATGTQQRSWGHYIEAKDRIQAGELGKVTFARCYWYQNYTRWKKLFENKKIDANKLDWHQWLGTARKQPFDPIRYRYWRFFWDFGGGSFTDLMTHWIDVIQWVMKSDQPILVQASGTTYTQDWLEAPDTVTASMQFSEGYTVTYDGALMFGLEGGGIVFRGDKAMMTLNRQGFDIYPEGVKPAEATARPEPIVHFSRGKNTDGHGTGENITDWLNCIRSRKTPNAHIRAGVRAAATSHWTNKALRENRTIKL